MNTTATMTTDTKITMLKVPVRVRYAECDPQQVAHHSAYPVWMEMARTELLRAQGAPYRDLEASGVAFVVAELTLRYRKPARYDDLLQIEVRVTQARASLVYHAYRILRDDQLLAEATSTLVCIDPQGRPQRIPQALVVREG